MITATEEQRIVGEKSYISRLSGGMELSREQIEVYLQKLEESGNRQSTLQTYERHLKRLYDWLPEDKYIQRETLAAWQDFLFESGYSVASVNISISAINSLMQFLGHRELQLEHIPRGNNVQPELTRTEYLRLLSTARMLEKKRAYLLVKIFGTTGIQVSDLKNVTAEAIQAGKIPFPSGSVRISEGLREELLNFMREEGIRAGPIFLTKAGKPQDRVSITKAIGSLCQDAQVPEEKGNPRCLRKLYQSTRAGILENISVLAEQSYDRLLEKEQNAVGWEQNF